MTESSYLAITECLEFFLYTFGTSLIKDILFVSSCSVIVPVTIFLLWKFKNDVFNRFCCFCCGGGERSKVRNLQQENQRLRQQLSQHRLSVSGRMQPGQFCMFTHLCHCPQKLTIYNKYTKSA